MNCHENKFCCSRCFNLFCFFRSTDALYRLFIVNVSKKVILWKSVEDILSQALTSILVNLQHQYANDSNALLYFCINQSHLVGGIRSSVHSLNYNRPDQMVKQFMADFYHYINSNADVKLDATFECYFHIISSKTLSKPGHRRTAIPVRSLVGTTNQNFKSLLKGSLINLPAGSPENPDCFKNACLVVTVVFMAVKKFQPNLYPSIRNLILVKPRKKVKNLAANVLLDEVKKVCVESNLNYEGPHELRPTLETLSKRFQSNLIVITSLEGSQPEVISYPEHFDETLPRLYFRLTLNDESPNHIMAIDNISTFFNAFERAICFKCNKFYFMGSNGYRHKCRHSTACRKCFGFSFNELTVKDDCEPWWYCDTLKDTFQSSISQTCTKCGTNFTSTICFENHLKYFCKSNFYYYQCPVCQKSISMRKRSLEHVQAEHCCNVEEKFCKVCNKTLPLHHICAVSKRQADKFWPNLAVVSVIFEDAASSMCQLCYTKQSRYIEEKNLTYAQFFQSPDYQNFLCDSHKTQKTNSANVIKLFYETDRFSFVGRTFSNNDFLAAVTNLNETMYCTYSSNFKFRTQSNTNQNQTLSNSKNLKSVSNQFLHFIKNSNLEHYTFILHTNAEMIWLLELFLSDFLHPKAILSGRLVKKISLSNLKIEFILFENYCKGSLNELSSQFNLNRSQHYFPMMYNYSKYYGQTIQLPPFDTFLSFNDSSEEVALKQEFYKALPASYDINVELYRVVTENLKTFLLSVTAFVEHSFKIQSVLAQVSNNKELAACHPFSKCVLSISGLAMAIFKFYFYNAFDGYSVDRPYTGFYSKVSAPEYEYMNFLSYTKPHENIIHAFNRREGQKSFEHIIVDGYSAEAATVYQFHGCLYHGHCLPDCTHRDIIRKNITIDSKNYLNVSIRTLQERTAKEKEFLLKQDNVNYYNVMFECTWQQFKKENKLLVAEFWKRSKLDPKRPLSRLVPRCAIRSGFNELYQLQCEATESQKLHYIDCNSLYSFIARDMEFPVGEYQVILEKDLQQHLKIINNKFLYKDEDCSCSIAHVSLLAPKDLYAPFLSYRFGEQNYTSLCFKCVQVKNTGVCRHKCPYKRRFTSTYTVLEIEYCLSLGYELLYCYEMYHYPKKAQVLSDFIKVISSLKLRATDIFQDVPTCDRQKMCDQLNVKMKFDEPSLQLTPHNVDPNDSQKQYLKNLLNSLFGRFALNSNYSKQEFVNSKAGLDNILSKKDIEILDIFPVSDSAMKVEYCQTGAACTSREGNLFYTALINAKARIFMYDLMQKLTKANCSVIYVDTDAILYSASPQFKPPVDFTPAFGDFKHVLGPFATIKKFYSLGCKNYCILYTEQGKLKYITKIKGLSVNSHNLTDKISPETYERFIQAHFEDQVINEYIPQSRCKLEKQTRTFKQIMLTQKFTSELHIKRYLLKKTKFYKYKTFPYGYGFINMTNV